MNKLAERAVLMRFSAGLPGQHRKDKRTTDEVKSSKGLGADSGKWVTDLFPKTALEAIKAKHNEARSYHESVTLPFGARESEDDAKDSKPKAIGGVGILPGKLILDYGETMRRFSYEIQKEVETFLAFGPQWVAWAKVQHNGTFDPKNYPGLREDGSLDDSIWRSKMGKKFYFTWEPLPVPSADHFTAEISSLLGVDTQSVDLRVRDAEIEARKEVMRRLIDPVKAMAEKLSEAPKGERDCPIFRDTLVQNIRDIAKLGDALNITDDPVIKGFVGEVEMLGRQDAESLRVSTEARQLKADQAAAVLKRLQGYSL